MSDNKRIFNFSAGPAVLPEPVLQKAADEMLNYKGSGMSVMELSHRSRWFEDIIHETEQLFRDLLNIPTDYHILFLQGGASLQFLMVPLNLLNESRKADYINTGAWSKKAIAEAKKLGDIHVVGDSSDKTFSYIPEINSGHIRKDTSYLHLTSHNTIYGTRFNNIPQTNVPVVSDMSSGILSEVINVSDYGMIYAGAQKNIGPSGVTAVIIRSDLVGRNNNLATMLDYKTHVDSGSMFNTPPTFAIYMMKLVFEHLKQLGGVPAMETINRRKAKLIYDAIDGSGLFKAHVQNQNDRSLMNIPFFTDSAELNAKFLQEAERRGLVTLKGHRSVGGMRASIYNAMPKEGCMTLAEFIREFDEVHS